MDNDRRCDPRKPDLSRAELITRGTTEGGRELPVLLRDVSQTGIGAVYIGQEPPPSEGDFLLRSEAAPDRTVSLLWTRQAADYVFLLGLAVTDGQPG